MTDMTDIVDPTVRNDALTRHLDFLDRIETVISQAHASDNEHNESVAGLAVLRGFLGHVSEHFEDPLTAIDDELFASALQPIAADLNRFAYYEEFRLLVHYSLLTHDLITRDSYLELTDSPDGQLVLDLLGDPTTTPTS